MKNIKIALVTVCMFFLSYTQKELVFIEYKAGAQESEFYKNSIPTMKIKNYKNFVFYIQIESYLKSPEKFKKKVKNFRS